MRLLPPKLRDLAAWIEGENPRSDINSTEVWEIGVPAKKSLSWSIVLAVLFSESQESFPERLKKLTGNESEVKEIKVKKKLSLDKIKPNVINKKLKSFNPFKNRHNFSHCNEISEIVRIFDLRLKRCANSKKSRTDVWNDDLKLKAASELLHCKIDVYFPENDTKKCITYREMSSTFSANIVLFQHEDQQHGAIRYPINIFYFAINLQQAHGLKLDALRHFFKKAKIASDIIPKVIELLDKPGTHGTAFLPTIIEKGCIDILSKIYLSPYIAFKLSEAGFETDPIERISDKPSPLCYALLCSTNTTYFRIMYDYASNCRNLFDRSTRRADDTVLDNLRRIKSAVESDISIVNSSNFNRGSTERAVHILKQINRFIEYQSGIANDLTSLRNEFKKKKELHHFKTEEIRKNASIQFRKKIILVITEHYLNFFCYKDKPEDISQQRNDFVSFTEYYELTDSFFHVSFFDNFFQLKLLFDLKEEQVLSSDAEGKMCLAIQSNKHFPINTERNGDILRHIPLHHRNVVKSELISLFQILRDSKDSEIKKELAAGSHSFPPVIDELILTRLNKYLVAVQEIFPRKDGMRAVMVIERAMQVIGESIKPSSSLGSIVSFLLRSCLPKNLQEQLIHIRNDLSHYRCNSVLGKLKIEKNTDVFEGIKKELKDIQDAFEIVNFTQDLRMEESMMSDCLNQLKDNQESNAYEKFMNAYELRLNQRTSQYAKYHRKCIELLLDSISDLLERSKESNPDLQLQMLFFWGQLKSIEYLLEFIGKNENDKCLNNMLNEVQNFFKENKDKQDDEIHKLINNSDQLKEMKDSGKGLNEMIKKSEIVKEVVKRQLNDLKENLAIFLPKCKDEILKNNPKKDETLCAPEIESFFKSLKQNMFSEEERKTIFNVVEDTLQEAVEAKHELEGLFKQLFKNESISKVEELLKKILLPHDKLGAIRSYYVNNRPNEALKCLKRCIGEDSIKTDVKKMIEKGSLISGHGVTVLTKIVFQRNSDSKYYTSPRLPDEIYEKLENFLAKKVSFLLNRLKTLKSILIEGGEEITATWQWGRSEAIQYHVRFLMRQRYMRDPTVCASLEMAYFDCINIFHKRLEARGEETDDKPDSNSLETLYEKSTDLFAGFDLRHLLSHRNNIPEAIGEVLDEDDFPSYMIEKILELIVDSPAIEAMLKLFKKSGVIERETFVDGVKNSSFHNYTKIIETINNCDRWERYIPLFPFIKT